MRPTSVWRLHEGAQSRRRAGDLRRVLGRNPAAAAAHSRAIRSLPGPGTRWLSCVATTSAHATEYVATLRAWLEAQGDPAEAGERLGVHENTVRYRLRKMAEIANLQLDDAKKRLAMMIELAAINTD